MNKFEELGLDKGMIRIIEELKFELPTEIQEKAIPLILKGKDIIGQSATGSGKTLAFGAGILGKISKNRGVQALILTPTRELAEQDSKSLKLFSRHYDIRVEEIYGGVAISPQIRKLMKANVVVGTPGRILDHLEKRTLNLSNVSFLVLDEADRMVDMGFLPDVERIINWCPKKRQTLLFSATLSPDINYIEKKYMSEPRTISVKSYVDPSKLKQVFYDVPTNLKFSLLVHLLKKDKSHFVMVFCNTRRNVINLTNNLSKFGLNIVGIHGGLNQSKRNSNLAYFHSREVRILICTDVAARGLDIKDVSHIYNYDTPNGNIEYIHRIGRTARAGKEGEAISLISSRDYQNFRKVREDELINIEEVKLPEFPVLRVNFSKGEREPRGFRPAGRGRDNYRSRGRSNDRRGFNRGGFSDRRGSRDNDRRGFSGRGHSNERSGRGYSSQKPRRGLHRSRY
ncbi:DEAD/DEAH box helicase [Candidatus Pacearchaeota archaeon]|nr:DEAD/DEAH box helicase [Candidatus Pacearchaeota archaeon]